jgi:ubiquinone/menaquinone biosynthesis C-methylase UbiE
MTCHGGFSLDESIRRKWYNPESILKDAGLKANMVFMDIGCGDGFFSVLASEIIGPDGMIYALDIDASAIEGLKRQAANLGLTNIRATIGPAEETVFCSRCADVVFFSMVLHDFSNPEKVLLNSMKMLKHTGVLVNLDWKKERMSFGPPMHIRFDENKTAELLKQAGFTVTSVKEAGPHHYVVTAKP